MKRPFESEELEADAAALEQRLDVVCWDINANLGPDAVVEYLATFQERFQKWIDAADPSKFQ